MKADVMYVEAPGDIVSVFDQWRIGGDATGTTSILFRVHSHRRSIKLNGRSVWRLGWE